ncbi:hypothetical protein D1647_02665 [Alistipes sp. Z76]|nr:hypothetical protein [Alistipes sp. Z76]NCE67112.1 hypothetical protein [Muribaculaceae bacterium M3]
MPPNVSEEWHPKTGVLSVGMPINFPFGKLWNDVGVFGQQPAETANECKTSCGPPRGEAAARATLTSRIYILNTCLSKNPRQKGFRTKGGRGDEALKIGERFR